MNHPDKPITPPDDPPEVSTQTPQQRAEAHAREAQFMAKEVAAKARAKTHETSEEIKAAAHEVSERVKRETVEISKKAKEHGRSLLNEQKQKVASEVRSYAEETRRASDVLKDESNTNLAIYFGSAADYLDRLGRNIEERELIELVDDVEEIARRRPEIFFGGMFVGGLAVARFLKASTRKRQQERTADPIDPTYTAPAEQPASMQPLAAAPRRPESAQPVQAPPPAAASSIPETHLGDSNL